MRRAKVRPATSARQVMTRFIAAGVIAFLVVGVGGAFAAWRAAEREAIDDAQQRTRMLADHIVAGAATDALVAGDPAAVRRMDRLVRSQVLGHGVLRVKLWTADGTVVYSDETELIGQRFEFDDDERAALLSGQADAALTNLARPENQFERGSGALLEVYLTIRTPSGRPLLFETYQSRSQVAARGVQIWKDFVPSAIGGLLVLLVCLVPLVWTLARQLESARNERERLLSNALHSSTTERRRIASHLHDGIVQSLAGVSYALAGTAENLGSAGQRTEAATVKDAALELRQDVRSLRSLLVEIYPPSLRGAGFESAVADLTAQLSSRGIEVDLDLSGGDGLREPEQALFFQVAQESVRNIVRHSQATRAGLELHRSDDELRFVVRDNGRGFDQANTRRSGGEEAHMGLTLLVGALAEMSGTLTVESAPGCGTTLIARIPVS
jgi:two-component system NarL family sensor kinase